MRDPDCVKILETGTGSLYQFDDFDKRPFASPAQFSRFQAVQICETFLPGSPNFQKYLFGWSKVLVLFILGRPKSDYYDQGWAYSGSFWVDQIWILIFQGCMNVNHVQCRLRSPQCSQDLRHSNTEANVQSLHT